MKVYHHVALYPDMFGESELKKIEADPQEGVPTLEDHHLVLGTQKIDIRGPLPNLKRVQAWRITYSGGIWRLEFRLNILENPLPKTGKNVGLDPGLRAWLTTSDGLRFPQHPEVVRLNRLIEDQENQRDSKQTDSNRYSELSRRIERNRQRLYDAQYDAANKVADWLVHRYDIIAFEDVDADERGIRNDPKYSEDSRKANWHLLRDVIKLRCIEAGKTFVLAPKWYTSQSCSLCDGYAPMHVDDRWFRCRHCGHESDRDQNAANVILNRGLEVLEGTSERCKTGWWVPTGFSK